jgi:hypothetical protein
MGRLSRFVSQPGDFVPGDTYLSPILVSDLLRRLGLADAPADEQEAAVAEWLDANPVHHQCLAVDLELQGYPERLARRARRLATSSSR